MTLPLWIRTRLRLWAIYNELGYIPWRKPRRPRKARKAHKGVYIGTREAIPFMNDDAKRTLSHLLLRPGYMMRDYILRGQHERYLAPFTALLVFYSFFTLLVAVVQPGAAKGSLDSGLTVDIENSSITVDTTHTNVKTQTIVKSILGTVRNAILLTRLDLHPEAADTHWKESLAALEGDLRSKGIPLFLGSFLLLWVSMSILLRKRGISISGAAAASGYVLCQFCIFMFLALLLSLGKNTDLGVLLMGALLVIDYHQWLGIRWKSAFWLTVRTGLTYLLIATLFFMLLGGGLVVYAYLRVRL